MIGTYLFLMTFAMPLTKRSTTTLINSDMRTCARTTDYRSGRAYKKYKYENKTGIAEVAAEQSSAATAKNVSAPEVDSLCTTVTFSATLGRCSRR